MKNKLETLTNKLFSDPENLNHSEICKKEGFKLGFKKAFEIIEEELLKELQNLEKHIFNSERIWTLRIYKAKIQNILIEMEKNYE